MKLSALFLYFIASQANALPVKIENLIMPDYSQLVEAVMPAVVNIVAFNSNQSSKNLNRNIGSGFIINQNGQLVTSYHIVEKCDNIKVITFEDKEYEAELIAFDKITDLALLSIKTNDVFTYVEISSEFKMGQGILIIGSPFGLGSTLSTGIISAKSRFIGENNQEFIQTDALINEGNSGGPWFNSLGKVIGITTRIVESKTGLKNIGIGLAIPGNVAINIIEKLKKYGKVIRPWIGISYVAVDKEVAKSIGLEFSYGALIQNVLPDSPAEKAGIKEGDVLLKIGDNKITNNVIISDITAKMPIEEAIEIEMIRSNKKIKSFLILGNQESKKTFFNDSLFGIEISGVPREIKHKFKLSSDFKGIFVTKITNHFISETNKLRPGDIVTQINDIKINNVLDFKNAMQLYKNSKHKLAIFYLYNKNGTSQKVSIRLK